MDSNWQHFFVSGKVRAYFWQEAFIIFQENILIKPLYGELNSLQKLFIFEQLIGSWESMFWYLILPLGGNLMLGSDAPRRSGTFPAKNSSSLNGFLFSSSSSSTSRRCSVVYALTASTWSLLKGFLCSALTSHSGFSASWFGVCSF